MSNEEPEESKNRFKLNQYLSVQKQEEEDMWISGEELRTEGSSDEELPRHRKGSRKSKRRRSKEATSHGDHRTLLLPNLNKINTSGVSIRFSEHEETIGSSECDATQSENEACGSQTKTDRLDRKNLKSQTELEESRRRDLEGASANFDDTDENSWRPKRGSLKLPSLDEEFLSTPKTQSQFVKSSTPNQAKNEMRRKLISNARMELIESGFNDQKNNDIMNKLKSYRLTESNLTKNQWQSLDSFREYSIQKNHEKLPRSSNEITGSCLNLRQFKSGQQSKNNVRFSNDIIFSNNSESNLCNVNVELKTLLQENENRVKVEAEEINNLKLQYATEFNKSDGEEVDSEDDSISNIDKITIPDFNDQSINYFVNEMSSFYVEMKEKLKLLKNCQVLNREDTEEFEAMNIKKNQNFDKYFRNAFKHFKNTSKMKKTLKFISKLEDDINTTIEKYKTEKSERLSLQSELADSLPKDKDTELFLQLCNYEIQSPNDQYAEDMETGTNNLRKNGIKKEVKFAENNFIEKNKKLAKIRSMNSLTDEEKQRLEIILADINAQEVLANSGTNTTTGDSLSVCNRFTTNPYQLNEEEYLRMQEIDVKLSTLEPIKISDTMLEIRNNLENQEDLLKQALRDIEYKLFDLSRTIDHENLNSKTNELDLKKGDILDEKK